MRGQPTSPPSSLPVPVVKRFASPGQLANSTGRRPGSAARTAVHAPTTRGEIQSKPLAWPGLFGEAISSLIVLEVMEEAWRATQARKPAKEMTKADARRGYKTISLSAQTSQVEVDSDASGKPRYEIFATPPPSAQAQAVLRLLDALARASEAFVTATTTSVTCAVTALR